VLRLEKTFGKNRIKQEKPRRNGFVTLFGIMVLVGFSVPYFGFGTGTTASAINGSAGTTSVGQTTGSVAHGSYVYNQLSLLDAYPYYIVASFMVAGGLSLYALTYSSSPVQQRSRYVSRMQTWARTNY